MERSDAQEKSVHFLDAIPAPSMEDNSEEEKEMRQLLFHQNRKNKKSGGFQSMGLSFTVFKGIKYKGYKVPTPIQRKCIPVIMEGKDVVAMARTGSGKTAAFLIPMFEKLKAHANQEGIRALILSPTRELALQTWKFCKQLGRFLHLKIAVILGGDRMEDHFAAVHENPDVIIATPGRFLHIIVEMSLKLNLVEYVVFDEADRLFEMGFQEQLHGLIKTLPENRQTLLFSATLPAVLVDFAKAGLNDPVLIRLDIDNKLSKDLKLAFFSCRLLDKSAVLMYLLKRVIKPTELTMVFVATKHDVEYLKELVTLAGLTCSYNYSNLDLTEKKIQLTKFQFMLAPIMIVTDIAARGIDIPMLDNVINFNFPSKPKLFIHRVGRVARAGRIGTAYSLVAPDEMPYLLDLHLSLGRPLKFAEPNKQKKDKNTDGVCGAVPQIVIDEGDEMIKNINRTSSDLVALEKVSSNGYKNYVKTRSLPSAESVKRLKDEEIDEIASHPLFAKKEANIEAPRLNLLKAMKNYRPHSTIFEVGPTSNSPLVAVMKSKREKHNHLIERHKLKMQEKRYSLMQRQMDLKHDTSQKEASSEVIKDTFAKIIIPSEKPFRPKMKKTLQENIKNDEYFIPYRPSNFFSEKVLEVDKGSFVEQASSAVLDLMGDDETEPKVKMTRSKWDRKKKKFVHDPQSESKKMIKTESGAWIPASYKKNIYKKWCERNKISARYSDEEGPETLPQQKGQGYFPGYKNKKSEQRIRRELKTKEDILKQRKNNARRARNIKTKKLLKAKKRALLGRRKAGAQRKY